MARFAKVKSLRYKGSIILLLLASFYGVAQTTVVEGVLKDEATESPLKLANLLFQGTDVGTTTNEEGYFILSIKNDLLTSDTLVFSSLGYEAKKVKITRGTTQNLEVFLMPSFFQLYEIDVLPGENAAWEIMRRIIANKDNHNPEKLNSYRSREYSKVRVDLNHFTEDIKKTVFFRPFDYMWENTQVSEDGIKYLPVLLIESAIDHYAQTSPRQKKDIVRGKNETGLVGPNIMSFVEDIVFAPNVYNNYVVILEKNFPSPINDNYKSNYLFYVKDSTTTQEGKNYRIVFKPKHKRELGFEGEMRVDSGSYAITEISLRFDIQANVNFVRSYYINQKYTKVDGEHYMLTESIVLADYTIVESMEDLTGFFGRKHSKYVDFSINTAIADSIFDGPQEVDFTDGYEDKDSIFWQNTRLSDYTEEDEKLIEMVDKLNSDPAFVFRKNLIVSFLDGYIPYGWLEIGDVYTFFSYNEIEKARLKFGFRINQELDLPVEVGLYGAYGTYDNKWKYNITTEWHIGQEKSTEQRIGFDYRYDINQLGRSYNNIDLDNILTSFVTIDGSASKFYVNDFNVNFEKNLTTGVSARINYFNSTTTPVNNGFFIENNGDDFTSVNSYHISGLDFTLKFSHLFEDISGQFYDLKDIVDRFRRYPDIAIKYTYSDQDLFATDFNFQKLKVNVRQQFRTRKLGYFTYNAEAGKTFGTAAYLYLDIPFANQQLLLDRMALNLMGFAEYVTDQYLYLQVGQHFDGLLLDRVPFVRNLKWRSFVFGKGYFGSLSDVNNNKTYAIPQETQALNAPYYEVGFGLENILKFARIDFIWRISDMPIAPRSYYFLIKPSITWAF